MPAWLASIFAAALPKLLEYLWAITDGAIKEQVAHAEIKKHVDETMQKYEALILQYDDLKDAGKITPEDTERLRLEKIKLEESLFNSIGHH